MVLGKVICGLIGLSAGSIPGLVIGVLVGHAFDRALGNALLFGSPGNIEQAKDSFFETTFLLSGYLAKVDGRISQAEIDHTEHVIAQMGIGAEQRQRAIELFRRGAAADFAMELVVAAFMQSGGRNRQLRQMLLLFLISLAQADHGMAPTEHAALVRIAGAMEIGAAPLERLLRMAQAQSGFRQQQGGSTKTRGSSQEDAYRALGVESTATDKEIKRAYRKLMSEHHPDKLIAKGVPEAMIKLATERTQEIQTAYELIKKSRPEMR